MTDDMALVGELIDRRFQVEAQIGSGGMGTVWSVRHAESLQRFALKTLTPQLAENREAVGRFLREARSAAALRTRHVVRIIDTQTSYEHQGKPLPFIVMELLEGRSLEEVLELRSRLEAGEVVWVFRQVCRALSAAHGAGIVHRDLKPANVFVAYDEEGESIVKLCDFGVAKLLGDAALRLAQTNDKLTETGALFGTPLYMAPEQLRGASRAIPATDHWALGLIAFRALSGREYFSGVSAPTELVLKIAQDEMPLPSRLAPLLPPRFDEWFLRACHRDASQRFSDVDALCAELEAALGHPDPRVVHPDGSRGAITPRGEWPEARRDEHRAHRQMVVGITAATLVGIVAVQWGASSWLERTLVGTSGVGADAGTDGVVADSAPEPPVAPNASQRSPLEPRVEPEPQVVPSSSSSAPHNEPARPNVRRARTPASTPPTSIATAPIRAPVARPSASAAFPSAAEPQRIRLESGQPCTRSAQCASGLCVAEACR